MSDGDVLAQVRQLYAAGFPAKLAEFEVQIAALEQDAAAADPLNRLRELTHRLRGSGGSYGFDELSRVAGEWEDLVTGLMTRLEESGQAIPSEDIATMRSLLARITEAGPDPE